MTETDLLFSDLGVPDQHWLTFFLWLVYKGITSLSLEELNFELDPSCSLTSHGWIEIQNWKRDPKILSNSIGRFRFPLWCYGSWYVIVILLLCLAILCRSAFCLQFQSCFSFLFVYFSILNFQISVELTADAIWRRRKTVSFL